MPEDGNRMHFLRWNTRRGGSLDHPSSVTSASAVFPSITTGGPHEFLTVRVG